MTTPETTRADELENAHLISLGVIVRLPASRLEPVLDAIAALDGVRVVYAKAGGAESLWIVEGARPGPVGGPR